MTKRKHIPKLSPEELRLAMMDLNELPLPDAIKKQLSLMVTAAANPDGESPEAIIASLPDERKQLIYGMIEEQSTFTNSIVERGGKALLAMDEAEWQRLVDEANAGG